MINLAKPHRIVDRAAIEAARKPYCEACGRRAYGLPHHVKTVGSGGDDIDSNLIQLCTVHHTMAHNGQLQKNKLKKIIERRGT
jgi:hypothetical protein